MVGEWYVGNVDIALSANMHQLIVGIYASAPIWGKLVDRQGPKPGFVRAFALLLFGYTGIKVSKTALQ